MKHEKIQPYCQAITLKMFLKLTYSSLWHFKLSLSTLEFLFKSVNEITHKKVLPHKAGRHQAPPNVRLTSTHTQGMAFVYVRLTHTHTCNTAVARCFMLQCTYTQI